MGSLGKLDTEAYALIRQAFTECATELVELTTVADYMSDDDGDMFMVDFDMVKICGTLLWESIDNPALLDSFIESVKTCAPHPLFLAEHIRCIHESGGEMSTGVFFELCNTGEECPHENEGVNS